MKIPPPTLKIGDYPQLALIATMALALRGLGHPREQAFALAQQYWDARDKSI